MRATLLVKPASLSSPNFVSCHDGVILWSNWPAYLLLPLIEFVVEGAVRRTWEREFGGGAGIRTQRLGLVRSSSYCIQLFLVFGSVMHLLQKSNPFMSLESCIAHWCWFLRRTNNLTMFVIVNWRQVSWRTMTLPCQGGVGVTQPLYWLKSLPNVLSWRKNWMYHRKMAHWNVSCNKSLGFLILIIIAQPLHVCSVFLEVCWL